LLGLLGKLRWPTPLAASRLERLLGFERRMQRRIERLLGFERWMQRRIERLLGFERWMQRRIEWLLGFERWMQRWRNRHSAPQLPGPEPAGRTSG
jgi:hypothetical protein